MTSNNMKCTIVKYADDTIVIGLIDKDNDESEYRDTIAYVADWCANNFLDLNVTKTKEMIFDFRTPKYKNAKEPVIVDNKEVEIVKQYKYLGVTIQNDLKWNNHINNQVKKANKRMYFLRCLAKLHVDSRLITMFYNSVVSSVLLYAVVCWFNSCSKIEKKKIDKFRKRVCKLVSPELKSVLENANDVHTSRCLNLVKRILKDETHPFHNMFTFLPSGERFNVIYISKLPDLRTPLSQVLSVFVIILFKHSTM
jgi:hypothetical protein